MLESNGERATRTSTHSHDQIASDSQQLDQLIELNYALLVARMLPELLHEANNELAVLQGSGELLALAKKVPDLEKLERRGQTIVNASHRLAGLCRLLERNPSGALTKTSCELTTVFHAVHSEITMLNSFDKIQWILEQSEPLSIECPAWVVKQVIFNLVSRSLSNLSGSKTEKKILTQFTTSETEISFHWSDNSGSNVQLMDSAADAKSGLDDEIHPAFDLHLCNLMLSRFQGRITISDDASGVISVSLPHVSPV